MQQRTRFKIPPQILPFLIHLAIAFLGGLLWYFALYSRFPLYTSHVNWIYNAGGDALQHQLGWEFFRHEPWQFPLGTIMAYGYPVGTSVAFMDSIPLLAIPFKLLSPWLEADFQYFGIWELSAIMGQMLFGLLILHEFTRSTPLKIIGASLLVLSPPMIFRAFYHNSLSAHWIILAAIWFVILDYRERQRMWRGAWVALFTVAILIHLYFIPMLAPLWLISMFYHYRRAGQRWGIIVEILAVAAALALAGYVTGLFSLGFSALSVSGFGTYSWNLNGLFNPFQFASKYIKDLPTGNAGQYEGFSYLGLGNILILPVAVYLFLVRDPSRRKLDFLLPFAAASIIYMLFALSNKAFLGSFPLWDIALPDPILTFVNLFRTSGRFIWPVFYFAALFGFIILIRNIRYPVPVLALVLLLQIADLQPLYEAKKLSDFTLFQNQMEGPFWDAASTTNQHLVVIPNTKLPLAYEPLAVYAVHNRMTLNLGYFARSDWTGMANYREQVWKDINANRLDAQTIYIITDEAMIAQVKGNLADAMVICEVDGFTMVFSPENSLTQSGVDLAAYCAIPSP